MPTSYKGGMGSFKKGHIGKMVEYLKGQCHGATAHPNDVRT
jgi:hypothetical protein